MLNKDLHRIKMYEILQEVFTSEIWKYLAFKWWTACYFFHALDRFSTDLDFDLLKSNQDIDAEVIKILEKYGRVKIGKYNLILSYWQDDVNIKIDINRKMKRALACHLLRPHFSVNPLSIIAKFRLDNSI